MNSREQDFRAKQEGDPSDSKFTKTPSTSRQWAGFRNPRIVRVSRTFGGKDRHSKVCTVRGLRDRRIRLSVPTAIQLYDLQDRLGLSQPSKVVDWLLDATKTEIDKLPPLQMPPGNFSQFFQPLAASHQQPSSSQSSFPNFFNASPSSFLKEGGEIKINDQTMVERSRFWVPDAATIDRKGTNSGTAVEKDKWISSNEQENPEELAGYAAQIQAQNFFPTGNHPSFPGLLNNALPYNPYYHFEPANLSLSQFGSHSFPIQAEDHSHMNYSSSMAIPSGSQLYLCPSAAALPTMIPTLPPYMPPTVESADPSRQINHFQFLSSSSQNVLPNSLMPTLHLISSPIKSLTLNVNPKILHSQESDSNEQKKEGTGS